MVTKPTAVDIRAYNVGFGDCFLVVFEYGSKEKRCVLIDFGSTGRGKATPATVMKDIANDVSSFVNEHCNGILHGVVATHRHKDHISGFAGESGKLLEALKPLVVLQPWTEDPKAARDAKSATASKTSTPKSLGLMQQHYLQSLADMHAFSTAALAAVDPRLGVVNANRIRFIADDNLANPEAIETLTRMGKRKGATAEYLRCGDKTALEALLPGVKIHVLGPPDLTQTEAILTQRTEDKEEFWQFMRFWGMHAGAASPASAEPLFPDAPVLHQKPVGTRWFIDRANRQLGNQLLGIVRVLDNAMNNTSLILLFEVGGKKLLFPGDAQIENWAYVLSQPKEFPGAKKLLSAVNLYKVGHHGSRNATPRTLWGWFDQKQSKTNKKGSLKTVVSTLKGKHHEVPKPSLVTALSTESEFHSTENMSAPGLFEPVRIEIRKSK